MYNIVRTKIEDWWDSYDGPPFHAILTDPPYHLTSIVKRFGKPGSAPAKHGKDGAFQRVSRGFMGQSWDGGDIAFDPNTWYNLAKHLYPGGFGFVFSGSRTFYKVAAAMEACGLVIHPMIAWVYGQGLPKATRIDKKANDEAWKGHRYGLQALKSVIEPIIVFQRPYEGKPLDNITQTGAGALNIDAGRIGSLEGRWPGNLILQHLPECKIIGYEEANYQINRFTDGMKPFGHGAGHEFESEAQNSQVPIYECTEGCLGKALNSQAGQSGDVSRFYFNSNWELESVEIPLYYEGKASPRERDLGLVERNPHPTVKPIALTQHLAKLLLPPEDYMPRRILIPFAGVGSEMIGAMLAGWDEITGIEMSNEYCDIAEARLEFWQGWKESGINDPKEIIKRGKTGRRAHGHGYKQDKLF